MSQSTFSTQHIEVIADHLGNPNSSPAQMIQTLVDNNIIKSDINHNERTELEETADIYWSDLSLSIEDFIIHCQRAGVLTE